MSEFFKHPYIVSNEYRADAQVLCMRCAKAIKSEKVRLMKGRNTLEVREVIDSITHSDYRLVPIEMDYMGQKAMTHLPVCADCERFELTDENIPLIHAQIVQANEQTLKWTGYPAEAIQAMKERWAATKILRRMEGSELVEAYKGVGGQ